MPRLTKPLSDSGIRGAKPAEKLYKLCDGAGLQLWVAPTGARLWRLDYRFAGKRRTYSIGPYPTVGLAEAREAAGVARKLVRGGIDPVENRRESKRPAPAKITFSSVADELLAKKRAQKRSAATLEKNEWLLGLVRPALGNRPIAEITAAEILAALQTVEARGKLETARRLRSMVGEVFRHGAATLRCQGDPTPVLREALIPPTVQHRPAILDPKAFGGLLRAIDGYEGAPETRAALQLLALTFVRPGELRSAEWREFNLDAALWEIPASKTKMKRPHRVPLAPQAVTILRELHEMTGHGRYLFPSVRGGDRHMSESTVNGALRRLGFGKDEMTGHGFRASASSMLNESGLWNPDAVERQLSHVEGNAVRKAYARGEHWSERAKMMSYWADRCDELRGK